MKKWLVTIAALWLAGCSSGEINKNYYQLPVVQSGTQSTASQGNRLLWVEQVTVPDYLAGNGVVYQTSDVKYVIANNNLWASPLDQQLRNTLVANLSTQLPGWVVASQPLGSAQDTLNAREVTFLPVLLTAGVNPAPAAVCLHRHDADQSDIAARSR